MKKNWHYIDFANKANIVIFWTLFNYSKRKKKETSISTINETVFYLNQQ